MLPNQAWQRVSAQDRSSSKTSVRGTTTCAESVPPSFLPRLGTVILSLPTASLLFEAVEAALAVVQYAGSYPSSTPLMSSSVGFLPVLLSGSPKRCLGLGPSLLRATQKPRVQSDTHTRLLPASHPVPPTTRQSVVRSTFTFCASFPSFLVLVATSPSLLGQESSSGPERRH